MSQSLLYKGGFESARAVCLSGWYLDIAIRFAFLNILSVIGEPYFLESIKHKCAINNLFSTG
jgi:hypothetical protein